MASRVSGALVLTLAAVKSRRTRPGSEPRLSGDVSRVCVEFARTRVYVFVCDFEIDFCQVEGRGGVADQGSVQPRPSSV